MNESVVFALKRPNEILPRELFVQENLGGHLRLNQSQLPLDVFPFCHDFALSDRHAVFFINSIVFGSIVGFLRGTQTLAQDMHFDNEAPMRIIVVDLETLEPVREFEAAAGAIIHFGNAFEDGSEVVIDTMYTDNFDAKDVLGDVFNPAGRFGGGTYLRYRLDLANGTMRYAQVSDIESEFPTFNPAVTGQRHAVTYTACSVDNGANSFFNGIQRVAFDGNAEVLTLPPGLYGSEPVFAPAADTADEDDGYLLEVVYDAHRHRSELQVFRAQSLQDRVCSLRLRHHLPHQFHGHFTRQVFAS